MKTSTLCHTLLFIVCYLSLTIIELSYTMSRFLVLLLANILAVALFIHIDISCSYPTVLDAI